MPHLNLNKNFGTLTGWLLLGGLSLLMSACAAAPAQTEAPKTIVLDPQGGDVSARAGDTLQVTLEANPSTGYIWEVQPMDETILRQDGEPEMKNDSKLMGAPVTQTFRFKTVAAGQVELKLIYHRPWEAEEPPERTFTARVTIE